MDIGRLPWLARGTPGLHILTKGFENAFHSSYTIVEDNPDLSLRFQSLRPYTPPRDVLDIFLREFDAAYEDGGLFQLTMHPHIIGYRSRIFILEEVIRHARSRPGVWFATHREVAEYAKAHAAQA